LINFAAGKQEKLSFEAVVNVNSSIAIPTEVRTSYNHGHSQTSLNYDIDEQKFSTKYKNGGFGVQTSYNVKNGDYRGEVGYTIHF